MNESAPPSEVRSPNGVVLQFAGAVVGAVLGAIAWYLLSEPQNLVNVVFSVLIGVCAGLGAGRFSRSPRSALGTVLAVIVTAVVLLAAQSLITRHYLTWATDHLVGAPSNPDWDGAIGGLRLAFDRAAGRNGWTSNASFFWWFISVTAAAVLAWYTAEPAGSDRR